MQVMRIALIALLVVAGMTASLPVFAQVAAADTGRTEQLVTLRLQDTPIRSAVDMLFSGTGKSYMFDPSVQGTVTTNLVEVPWNTALNSLLKTTGLTMRQDGGVYIISPKKEVTSEISAPRDFVPEAETEVEAAKPLVKIPIGFIDVADLADIFGVQSYGTRAAQMGGYGGGMGGYGMGGYGMGSYGMGGYGMGGYGMGSSYGMGGYGMGSSYGMGGYGMSSYGMGSYGMGSSYGGYGGYGGYGRY